MDILKFHIKSISHFGLLSSTYLIEQRLSLLELQINYLWSPYDIQEKISSHVQGKWFNEGYVAYIDYYHNHSYNIWDLWSIKSTFLIYIELVVLAFQPIQPPQMILL